MKGNLKFGMVWAGWPVQCFLYTGYLAPMDFIGMVFNHLEFQKNPEIFAVCVFSLLISILFGFSYSLLNGDL